MIEVEGKALDRALPLAVAIRRLVDAGTVAQEDLEESLVKCARHGRRPMVEALIENGACTGERAAEALRDAILHQRVAIAHRLIDAGAVAHELATGPELWAAGMITQGNVFLDSLTSIMSTWSAAGSAAIATRRDNTEILQRLFDTVPPQTDQLDKMLWMACKHGSARCVPLLVRYGADPNAHGALALRMAVAHRHGPVVRALLESGASPNVDHGSPLLYACTIPDPAMVRELLRFGADPALFIAASARTTDSVLGKPVDIARSVRICQAEQSKLLAEVLPEAPILPNDGDGAQDVLGI